MSGPGRPYGSKGSYYEQDDVYEPTRRIDDEDDFIDDNAKSYSGGNTNVSKSKNNNNNNNNNNAKQEDQSDKFKTYTTVVKRHIECLEVPNAAILWIVDNGTVSRTKYQIPKTHHNPARSDRERGGYAEILRELGWKSNYANDGHYDWWMKPEDFEILTFKDAVNALRTSKPQPRAQTTSASGGGMKSPTHRLQSPPTRTSSPTVAAVPSKADSEGTALKRQRRPAKLDPPPPSKAHTDAFTPSNPYERKRGSVDSAIMPTSYSALRRSSDVEFGDYEESKSVKRSRTTDETSEECSELETRYIMKKKELDSVIVELEAVKTKAREFAAKERELSEKKDKVLEAVRKMRVGLKISKVQQALLQIGEAAEARRQARVLLDKERFSSLINSEWESIRHLLQDFENQKDPTSYKHLEELLNERKEPDDVKLVKEWMKKREELAHSGSIRQFQEAIVEDLLLNKREVPASLSVAVKKADDALKKHADLENKVIMEVRECFKTEDGTFDNLNVATKARNRQREECIIQICLLLAGPLREVLSDTDSTPNEDLAKLEKYYFNQVVIHHNLRMEAQTLEFACGLLADPDSFHMREILFTFDANFPELRLQTRFTSPNRIPPQIVLQHPGGEPGYILVAGTKIVYLKELVQASHMPPIKSWPPQWLADVQHMTYILPIIGLREYEGKTWLQVSATHMTLQKWLKHDENRTQTHVLRLFANMLVVIDMLSEQGKIVLELRPENVFIINGNAVVDISSNFFTKSTKNPYGPPDDSGIGHHSYTANMWAIAMMLYEACYGTIPTKFFIEKEALVQTPTIFDSDARFKEHVVDLLAGIFNGGEEGERMTSAEALGHPLFGQPMGPNQPVLTPTMAARAKLSALSHSRTQQETVKALRNHIIPSVINAYADSEKRRKGTMVRWDVYFDIETAPSFYQPFTRELLVLFFKEVFKSNSLVVCADTGRYLPNSTATDPTPFLVVGWLMAKAALAGTSIQCQFASSVFRYILSDATAYYTDLTTALEDLYSFDTSSARQIKLNIIQTITSIDDGNGYAITEENKKKYYLDKINKRLVGDIRKQLDWLKQGFKEAQPVWEILSKVDPIGLSRIVSGRQWVDIGLLKRQFIFDPVEFKASSTPTFLTRTLDEWASTRAIDKLQRLIYVCTSYACLPVNGLARGIMVIKSHDNMPHSQGCGNMLHLPERSTYAEFKEMMEDVCRMIDSMGSHVV